MSTASRKPVLALIIFTFAFIYRLALMLSSTYPPGADIGLHNSVIYSITGPGQTDFLYNFYHIGGGLSLTFPGYHIFTAGVMMLTGMTSAMEPVAHALVVSLFSSLTVLSAFLITRRIWSIQAAYIVALLAVISRFDIEMTMWAGYPNVITLLLIPLTFYLYLEKGRFSNLPFLVTTSILVGSLFLTHSLSVGIFVAITTATLVVVAVSPKTFGTSRKTVLYWFLPIVLGAILVLPFLVQAVPAYLSDNAYLNGSAGSSDIGSATLSARVLPLSIVVPLFGLIPAFLVFTKVHYKRWVNLPAFLLCVWVFVCLALTQGYLVKIPFDYNRFLYFLILPLLIFVAVLIDYVSDFFAKIIETYRTLTRQTQTINKLHGRLGQISSALTRKNLYSMFVLFFLLTSFVAVPIFATPTFSDVGLSLQRFYQTMTPEGWDAMQWAKQNTPSNAVFVSDALYGWWFGGFAQRPTLSAVDPQYLSLNREMDNATFARNILDTNYIIDNNSTLIPQVRDDGGYIARHNPQILVRQNWTYYPSSFFNFNSNGTSIRYHVGEESQQIVWLDSLLVKEMRVVNDSRHASIIVVRGNNDLNYTVTTTVNQGIRFVNITSSLTSLRSGVAIDWVDIKVEAKEDYIQYENEKLTAAFVDVGTKSFGQLIFSTKPMTNIVEQGKMQLTYSLEGKSQANIEILATAYSESNIEAYYSSPEAMSAYFTPILTANLANPLEPIQDDIQLEVFNYSAELQARSVAYIACRDAEVNRKFRDDPLFSLVFINEGVAIFKVHGNLK